MTDSTPPVITPDEVTPRQRGAPRGNKNALKHGFYSHTFTRTENKRLDEGILGQLDDEEALLHVLLARTAEAIKDHVFTFEEAAILLRATSLASGRLESIQRTRKSVYDNQTVLEKVWEELSLIPFEED